MEHTTTLIVGAGPTGLGAAWRLSALGHEDWTLCEAEARVGGLAGSVIDPHGFTWDYGGHVQHSHYPYFDALMDDLLGEDGWLWHERTSYVWVAGRFVPYPFQHNLHRLPAGLRDTCVQGLRQAAGRDRSAGFEHFDAWIAAVFGDGIGDVFMRPYNRKVWAHPLDEMDWRWIGDRVARVDLSRIERTIAANRDDVTWGPNYRFRYPRRGGTGAVWQALAERLAGRHPRRLCLGHRLAAVDTRQRTARFTNGRTLRYERLLTTMPIDLFVGLTDLAAPLGPAAAALSYTSTHVFGVGLRGRPPASIAGTCWMYFPEDDCPFYRVTLLSRYSPENVPDASRDWSLLVEVSEPGTPTRRAGAHAARPASGDETASWPGHAGKAAVVEGLARTGLIDSVDQVRHVWHTRLERGYPVPTRGRDAALAQLLPMLQSRNVFSRGRFGAWRYEVSNQDHSVAQGVELVDWWMHGTPERTVHGSSV